MNLVAEVFRGDRVESTHLGNIAVADAAGNLLYQYGDALRPTFARSSMKPIQAIPVVETGAVDRFAFDAADLALCCGSHNGEPGHTRRVLAMLARAGQPEAALQCGAQPPRDRQIYKALLRAGQDATPVFHNCSGKHAGMIATAVHMGENPRTYLDPWHPVQLRILDAVAHITGYSPEGIYVAVDGCGVPAHQVPLAHLAWGYARLARPEMLGNPNRAAAVRRVTDAMVAEPDMVAGTGRYCTDLMRAFGARIVAKSGAEAVFCLGDRQTGVGVAVKIEDGGARALYAVVNEILRQLGIGAEGALQVLAGYDNPIIPNMSGKPVGRIGVRFQLQPSGLSLLQ